MSQLLREQERSQAWLARKLDLDPSLFSHYLAGRRKAPADLATRIAEVLGVSVEDVAPSTELAA